LIISKTGERRVERKRALTQERLAPALELLPVMLNYPPRAGFSRWHSDPTFFDRDAVSTQHLGKSCSPQSGIA